MSFNFIHLRCHSSYSLSEGAIKPEELIELVKKNRMPAVALTDSGNLFCSLEFSMLASKSGIQPIIGCIIKIDMEDKSSLSEVVLLAKNEEGYSNLLKLCSNSFLLKDPNLPNHIKLSDLLSNNAGLILLSGGVNGPIGKAILNSQKVTSKDYTLLFKEYFADRFYMEIMRHGSEEEENTEESFLELAFNHDIPLVATNDVMFATKGMYEAQHALTCIASGTVVGADKAYKITTHHYFKNASEMQEIFKDLPEAIENTVLIAKRCCVMAQERAPILPKINNNESQELISQAREGLKKRLENFSGDTNEYFERLEFELEVIGKMNFPGYFLIVSDFIKWSKRNGIPVGPGRGSGAGSVVAWSLEITDLDPIRFGLLFERFLNPERISLPDFDIDFCQHRRDEVIKYVQEKYGEDKVAQIITFGKLQARAVLRDVGRVLQIPYGQVDRIAKLVPFNAVNPVTLSQAIEMEPQIRQAAEEDSSIDNLLKIALQLEGLNRHASIHAAGLVIGDRPLIEMVPLYKDDKSTMLVLQYSMKYAEAAGLVKFDFLGLKTLTVIDNTIKLIHKSEPNFDINRIPLDNEKVFELMSKGLSTGVFQFESAGMKDALRKMKPDCFEELVALGALYRPGPMDNIPTYIACKHGIQQPDYLHPSLEVVLKETFGVIIYQEQVMKIAQILAGYSLGAADLLRKAMGKKIKAEMDAQREIFVQGAIKNSIGIEQATYIFDLVAKFAGYGFNKAHATAYAMISYQTAYLKANYLIEFLVASLNLEIDDTDKINIFQQEAKCFGITVLPADINLSDSYFKIENGAIRYGLGALKNVGVQIMEELCNERKKNGEFLDILNFIERAPSKLLNKRLLESLIKSGSFDSLNNNRQQLFIAIDLLSNYHNLYNQEKNSSQIGLFGNKNPQASFKPTLPNISDWNQTEKISNEYEAIGFYLSSHPLDEYLDLLNQTEILNSDYLKNEQPMGYASVYIAGIITSTRTKSSPRGRYVLANFSDTFGNLDLSFFEDQIIKQLTFLSSKKTLLCIKVELRKDEGGIRLTAQALQPLDEYLSERFQKLHIKIESLEKFRLVKQIISKCRPGRVEMVLEVSTPSEQVVIDINQKFEMNLSAYKEFIKAIGKESIHFSLAPKRSFTFN